MTLAERLQAMEMLWESISVSQEKLKSPAWHGDVLKERLAKVKAGKGSFLTVQQLKERLAKKRS